MFCAAHVIICNTVSLNDKNNFLVSENLELLAVSSSRAITVMLETASTSEKSENFSRLHGATTQNKSPSVVYHNL